MTTSSYDVPNRSVLWRSKTWPGTTVRNEPSIAAKSALFRYVRVNRLRMRALEMRTDTTVAWKSYEEARHNFNDYRKSLMESLRSFKKERKKYLKCLDEGSSHLELLDHELDHRLQRAEKCQRRQHSLEVALTREESDLFTDLQGMFAELFPFVETTNLMQIVDSSTSENSRSRRLPSVLRAYCDAAGEAGIYREREAELAVEYQEWMQQRDHRQDQGEVIAATETSIGDRLHRRLEELRENVIAADARAAELATQCQERGIDLTRPRYQSSTASEPLASKQVGIKIGDDDIPKRGQYLGVLGKMKRGSSPSASTRGRKRSPNNVLKSSALEDIQRWFTNLVPVMRYNRYTSPQWSAKASQYAFDPEISSAKSAPGWLVVNPDGKILNEQGENEPDAIRSAADVRSFVSSEQQTIKHIREPFLARPWHSDSTLLPSIRRGRFDFGRRHTIHTRAADTDATEKKYPNLQQPIGWTSDRFRAGSEWLSVTFPL